MSGSTWEPALKTYRKKRIVGDEITNVDHGRETICRLLPHRDPILSVDAIDFVDPESMRIRGRRVIPSSDPVFEGHFPGYPVYPGTWLVEMIGQLGLCLYYFVRQHRIDVAEDASPAPVRATKILGAHFLAPVPPGAHVTLEAIGLEDDGYFATAIGQAVVDGKIVCVSVGEVCFLE